MAHRHKMQARARGGRTASSKEPIYAGSQGHVDEEAKSKKETFKRGGGTAVGKAFGGAVKGRADKRKRGGAVSKGFAFASGGKVWSHARGGIGGTKGMAAEVMKKEKMHGEMHDNTVKTANDGNHTRSGHGGKAAHQYKDGGKVKPAFKRGGPAHEKEEKEQEEEDDDDEDPGYKRGGGLKMHYVGGHGKRHKRADGGAANPEPDEDDIRPRMEKGGGCWMEKAFSHSHGQFKAKAKKAGMSTEKYAGKEAASPSASTKTRRQANLAKIGAEYGGG